MPPELQVYRSAILDSAPLQRIWRWQLDYCPYEACFVTMMRRSSEGRMIHKAIPLEDAVNQTLEIEAFEDGDLYFCPNVFLKPKRRERNACGGALLYQDLDEVAPGDCSVRPSWWWETSPGRYQGIWCVDEWIDQERLMRLNKALNREVRADKGTWNATRLLRVPHSYNGKRGCLVSGLNYGL